MTMDLANLPCREDFASTRRTTQKFEGELKKILNLLEVYANNRTIQRVAGIYDNRQCYACRQMCHIDKFF